MRFAYGFWRYGKSEKSHALEMIALAREAGIDILDTADCYGSSGFGDAERLLGELRREAPSLFEGVTIATKAGIEFGTPYNSSAEHLARAVDASLARMSLDCIDLLYVHRPDALAHPEEVAEALDRIVAAGKANAIAVSNYTPAQIDALRRFLKAPVAAHQVEFSVMRTAPVFDGVFDHAMTNKTPVFAWSPLAGGALFSSNDPKAVAVRSKLEEMALAYGVTPSAVALAFVTAHPAEPIPIIGTKNATRMKEAIAAQKVELTRREWYDLLQTAMGQKLP